MIIITIHAAFYIGMAFAGFFVILIIILMVYKMCYVRRVVVYPDEPQVIVTTINAQGQEQYWQGQPQPMPQPYPYPYQQQTYPPPYPPPGAGAGQSYPPNAAPWGAPPVMGTPVPIQPPSPATIQTSTVQVGGQQPSLYPPVMPQGADR